MSSLLKTGIDPSILLSSSSIGHDSVPTSRMMMVMMMVMVMMMMMMMMKMKMVMMVMMMMTSRHKY